MVVTVVDVVELEKDVDHVTLVEVTLYVLVRL
jgi:hypothetical protein